MSSETQQEKFNVDVTDSAADELRSALDMPGRQGKAIRLVFEGFG